MLRASRSWLWQKAAVHRQAARPTDVRPSRLSDAVSAADSPAALGMLTGRHHLAFQAQNAAMVDAFYKAALANGGTANGAPGKRPYHPGYYAAFVLDPNGNNIEAVYHGEANRSAPSVKITF